MLGRVRTSHLVTTLNMFCPSLPSLHPLLICSEAATKKTGNEGAQFKKREHWGTFITKISKKMRLRSTESLCNLIKRNNNEPAGQAKA